MRYPTRCTFSKSCAVCIRTSLVGAAELKNAFSVRCIIEIACSLLGRGFETPVKLSH